MDEWIDGGGDGGILGGCVKEWAWGWGWGLGGGGS